MTVEFFKSITNDKASRICSEKYSVICLATVAMIT